MSLPTDSGTHLITPNFACALADCLTRGESPLFNKGRQRERCGLETNERTLQSERLSLGPLVFQVGAQSVVIAGDFWSRLDDRGRGRSGCPCRDAARSWFRPSFIYRQSRAAGAQSLRET